MDTYKLNFTFLELEIVSFLGIKAGEKLSQREIARYLDVSPTAVASALKSLKAKDLIKLEETKTINFISYNRDNPKAIELKRAENLKNIYISGLSGYLEEKLAGATVILFGSYSKGEDTKGSDIDIAVVGRKEKIIELEKYEKAINRKISIQFYSSWKGIHRHLKNNILNGIVLCGSVDL